MLFGINIFAQSWFAGPTSQIQPDWTEECEAEEDWTELVVSPTTIGRCEQDAD